VHVAFPRAGEGKVDVVGMTIAGSPFVVVGHNARVAWGSTTLMADQVDFVRLELDATGGSRFRGHSGWEPIEERTERIAVKDAAPVRHVVRTTRFGPIVEESGTAALARQWTVARASRTVIAVHAFQRARSVAEWLEAAGDFTSPGQGMVVADVEGHIAYKAAAAIPLRGTGDGRLPTDARDPAAAWRGIVPPAALPAIVDPATGFLVTANNQIGRGPDAMRITQAWAQPSRAERITELLSASRTHDVASMSRIQGDVTAPLARRLIAALPAGPIRDPEARRAWEQLRGWNGRYEAGFEPGLFELLHRELRRAIFEDDVGGAWTEAMPGLLKVTGAYEFAGLTEAARARDWIDDARTPARETMRDVLERALVAALRRLRARDDGGEWRRAHTLKLPHPLGRVRPLDRIFDVGPVPVRGGRYTPCATSGNEEDPFVTTSIPVYRMVVDLGDLARSRIVNSVGQSGHRLSAHWDDQLEPWRRGELLPMRWAPSDVRAHTEALLVLSPR
jgi:penicillin amidase